MQHLRGALCGVITALFCALLFVSTSHAQQITDLQARLAQVEAAGYDETDAAWATNYPYARLQLRKAEAVQGHWYLRADAADQFVTRGLEALDRLGRGQAMYAEPGHLTELAYVTGNDHTAQPYHLYLPPDYDPMRPRPTPLIVFLHGYVPTTSVLDPWTLQDSALEIAGHYGCMLLIPYARRNTDFQGIGETDVFASMEQVKRLYCVDESRIYLNGVSMGGMGAWTIGLRHPGVFAAITPIAGQTDMFRWWGWEAEQMPPFRRWLIEWDNPYHVSRGLRSQQFFVQHGERDQLISADQSRLMVQRAREQDDYACVEYFEHPGADHYIYFRDETFDRAFARQMENQLDPSPMQVAHTTYSLEYDTAFYVTIEQFEEWGKPAWFSLLATAVRGQTTGADVEVESENIARLSIDIAGSPLERKSSYIFTDGTGRRTVQARDGRLVLELGQAPPEPTGFPPLKRKGLCGPAEEVFDDSFIVVQGTAGNREQNRLLAEQVERFAHEWDEFADGCPRVKLDRDITEQDIAGSNLVLFGRPQTNLILARIYFRLPIRIGDRRYAVGDREYAGDDLGLVMCYPNPLNPDRYVLIFAGEYWGERLSENHKYDMLPDFIVFTTRRFATEDGANQHLCAGFFDLSWQLSEKLTDIAEPVPTRTGSLRAHGLRLAWPWW